MFDRIIMIITWYVIYGDHGLQEWFSMMVRQEVVDVGVKCIIQVELALLCGVWPIGYIIISSMIQTQLKYSQLITGSNII